MNSRTLILLVIAVIVAVITVVVVRNHSGSAQNGPKILVATTDIEAGAFIHADKDVSWVDWPGNMSPAYITPDAHHIEEFNGAVARYPISSGVPVTVTAVVRASDGGFMSAVLTPGMRAVSIAVSATTGNAGFVFPGDKVDLLLTHKITSKESAESVLASETFIENVRVLAIDQMLENPDNKAMVAKTITLEVLPKQAEMINVATSLGSISVSLRSLARDQAVKPAAMPVTGTVDAKPADAKPADTKPTDTTVAVTPMPVTPVIPETHESNYSTNNDVSKLMGDKNAVHAKVNVYHGATTEQLDFHQGNK